MMGTSYLEIHVLQGASRECTFLRALVYPAKTGAQPATQVTFVLFVQMVYSSMELNVRYNAKMVPTGQLKGNVLPVRLAAVLV